LGFVMDLLSAPIRVGYLNGVALIVIVIQLPKLLGFSADSDGLVDGVDTFIQGVVDGLTEAPAAAIGLASLAVILLLRQVAPAVPGLLVAVMGATAAVWLLDLHTVPVVGPLPRGLPAARAGRRRVGRRLLTATGRVRDRVGRLRRYRRVVTCVRCP